MARPPGLTHTGPGRARRKGTQLHDDNRDERGDDARDGAEMDGTGREAPDPAPAGLTAPLPLPGLRPVRDVVVAVLLSMAAAVALTAAFIGVGPARVDGLLLDETIESRSRGLTTLAVAVTELGSTVMMAVLAVGVASWCWYVGRRADAMLAIAAMAGGAALFTGLKDLLGRDRPPEVERLVVVANESLPSGHATMAVAVIGAIVVLAWEGRGPAARVAMVAAAAVWIGAVGFTRVYLGVHWFSDVVAGWLVGGAWLALCVAVWSWWRARHLAPAPPGGSGG